MKKVLLTTALTFGALIFWDSESEIIDDCHSMKNAAGWTDYTKDLPMPVIPTGVNVRKLQSLPGAPAVLWLNFDGGSTVKGSYPASGKTDQEIYGAWSVTQEDYAPFIVNVTTDKSIYDATPAAKRFQVVLSPTLITPGASGWAWGSENLAEGSSNMNWLAVGEVATHESGHLFGNVHAQYYDASGTLKHYYQGQGYWGPIMGSNYQAQLTQWDQGEFDKAHYSDENAANLTPAHWSLAQKRAYYIDRTLIIGNSLDVNNTGNPQFRVDDHADGVASASTLEVSGENVLKSNNAGVISQRTDVDLFEFSLSSNSEVSLNILPDSVLPNLNIRAELLDVDENVVAISDLTSVGTPGQVGFKINLDASFNKTLSAGKYFIKVDGVGEGDPKVSGYSDYGSLGQYTISGTIKPSQVITAINNIESAKVLNVNKEFVTIEGLVGGQYKLYNTQGSLLETGEKQANKIQWRQSLSKGVYFLSINRQMLRFTIR